MRVIGSDSDLQLSGPSGELPGDVVFALGGPAPGAGIVLTHAGAAGDVPTVAPAGNDLWRHAPWPVNDALFDLPAPAAGGGILVAGEPDALRSEVARKLKALGREVESIERLTVPALRAAAVVVLLARHDALPAQSMCVLAARRVLITSAADITFGLAPGIELLRAATGDEAVEQANMAALHHSALAITRALGAAAARHHRASLVYPQLAGALARD